MSQELSLVQKLRQTTFGKYEARSVDDANLRREAADRIEQLESRVSAEGMQEQPVAYRVPNQYNKFDYFGSGDTVAAHVLEKAEPLYAAPPAVQETAQPVARGFPCYGVFRQQPDENNGNEYFWSALWHNDTQWGEGHRVVKGRFFPDQSPPAEQLSISEEQIPFADKVVQLMLEKDAARYRWLRDKAHFTDGHTMTMFRADNMALYGLELDEAIDSALLNKKTEV